MEFAGQSQSTRANADRKWTVTIDALDASAVSRELIVRSLTRNRSVKIADVIVGEVWAGGGQSNIEFDMEAITSAAAEIEASANPTLRQFHVLKNPPADAPADYVQGYWAVARPGTTEDFIAAGYYFAKTIQRELKTPVGLIKVLGGARRWRRGAIRHRSPHAKTAPRLAILRRLGRGNERRIHTPGGAFLRLRFGEPDRALLIGEVPAKPPLADHLRNGEHELPAVLGRGKF